MSVRKASLSLGVAACVLLAFGLQAQAADQAAIAKIAEYHGADRHEMLVEGARKEGTLTLYSSMIVDQALQPLVTAFHKEYPFENVKFVRADPPQLMQKLLAEARAQHYVCDVLESTSMEVPTTKAKLVRPFWSPELKAFPADWLDPGHRWAPTRVSYLGVAYNTKLVDAKDAPHSYDDLLDPKWKGKMAWSSENMGAMLIITGIRHFMGEEKADAYLKKLGTQDIAPIATSNRAVLNRVIAGEYALELDAFLHHPILSAEKGAPSAPDPINPVVTVISSVELPKHAPHPYSAMLFIDFLLSKKGQTILRDAKYFPAREDVDASPELNKIVPSKIGMKANFLSPELVNKEYPKSFEIFKKYFSK